MADATGWYLNIPEPTKRLLAQMCDGAFSSV